MKRWSYKELCKRRGSKLTLTETSDHIETTILQIWYIYILAASSIAIYINNNKQVC